MPSPLKSPTASELAYRSISTGTRFMRPGSTRSLIRLGSFSRPSDCCRNSSMRLRRLSMTARSVSPSALKSPEAMPNVRQSRSYTSSGAKP